jgi:hypothetical protein
MTPKIGVIIRKNSHKVIRVKSLIITTSVQSDRRYCQYNNEGADEMIITLFPPFLSYCELLWQHFPPGFLNFNCVNCDRIYQVLHVPPQEEVSPKFSRLEEHSRTLHHTQHNIYVFTIRK